MKKILLAAILIVASVGGLASVAGAGTPCAIAGSDQGWYWHGNKVMQCVYDNNHIVVRQWGSGGVDEGVVLDAWYPASAYYWVTVHGPGISAPFAFCPATWNGYSGIFTTTNQPKPSGWDQTFYASPEYVNVGAINHFYNAPGTQAYGNYAHFTDGNCPYGGAATTFIPG